MKKLFIIHIVLLLIFACGVDDGSNNNPPIEDIIVVDSTKINRKVLVIGIDGFRSDVMQDTITPFLHSLTKHNNLYYTLDHITEGITYSGPNWSSMLTGVHLDKHNVTGNGFENDNYDEYPPFFYYIEQANENINTASIVNWTPINTYILSNYADYAPLESINDLDVFEAAKNTLLDDGPNHDIIFLQFDELDGAGHEHGFSPFIDGYINTAATLDGYCQSLFNIINDKRLNGEDWLYVIISDHGGEGTGHGDADHPNINRTIFFVQHPELIFKANCCYTSSQVDLATTVLDFLGISSSQFEYNQDGNSIIE